MGDLMRIRDGIEIALTHDFLAIDDPSGLSGLDSAADFEEVTPAIGLAGVEAVLQRTMSRFAQYDTAMDASMVVDFHRALPLARRQAADARTWAWLGVVRYPAFVAWRWKPSGSTGLRAESRFFGDRVRQTFSRLWWAAELSREGQDYALTEELFALSGFQDIYEAVFGRAFGNFRPALAAFVEVAGRRPEAFVRQFAKELGYGLTTSVLETMGRDDLVSFMEGIAGAINGRRDAPA